MVLIVEDNPLNQQITYRILKRLGYTSEIAENGVEGIEKLATSQFNLVLMDIQMPLMDGIEATKYIRSKSVGINPLIPIIAVTANSDDETKQRCFEAGMNDFISKPIRIELLAEVLSHWIT